VKPWASDVAYSVLVYRCRVLQLVLANVMNQLSHAIRMF